MQFRPPASDIDAIPSEKQMRIGDVSDLFAVERHVLRFWEKEFDELRPRKTSTNQRCYAKRDLELIWVIKYLLYYQNFTVLGAASKLKEIASQKMTLDQIQDLFENMFQQDDSDAINARLREGLLNERLNAAHEEILMLRAKVAALEHEKSEFVSLEEQNQVLQQRVEQLKEMTASLKESRPDFESPVPTYKQTLNSLKDAKAQLASILAIP